MCPFVGVSIILMSTCICVFVVCVFEFVGKCVCLYLSVNVCVYIIMHACICEDAVGTYTHMHSLVHVFVCLYAPVCVRVP